MPLHDWTRVDAGLFHDFHRSWTVALSAALNDGGLPSDYFALLQPRFSLPAAEVLTLRPRPTADLPHHSAEGLNIVAAPPRADVVRPMRGADAATYARRADRIAVRHRHGRIVAMVDVVSPGNKAGRFEARSFVETAADMVRHGIHVLVIDPFPPGRRDPQGLPAAVWDEFADEPLAPPPPARNRTVAAFDAGDDRTAYVSFVGVGDPLPDMPLFLRPGVYVPAPLEASYRTAWEQFPAPVRGLLASPGSGT